MCHITYGAIIRLSTYCKVHSQIQLVSCCEGFPSHLKERFLHLITEKNVYFALCHTLHHYKTLWIIFALRCVHVVYIIIIFPYCISSATIFPISTLFSPSFFDFSRAVFFYISIYCGFTLFYHYAALVVPFCTWLCFFLFSFALLM